MMALVKQAVILVGGQGTRLGSVTCHVPKPMLLVGGVPFLEYLLEFLRPAGIERVLFCSGYLASCLEEHFGTGQRHGYDIGYSVEPCPAGTGGALLNAHEMLDTVFYVLNGDTFFEANLQRLSEVLLCGSTARLAAIALREVENVERYGGVRIQKDCIMEFAEKQREGRGLINGGIYCLRREVLELLPTPPCSLERDLFPKLARNGLVGGMACNAYFIDIGLPETLARAQLELPARFFKHRR